jgi:hypothetical protein
MATKPIIGYVTVGGARKEISGGYVNIGGVWKPIVKTYVNVNGVWKNAWKELYTWKKYTVKTKSVYKAVKASSTSDTTIPDSDTIYTASAYTFDTSTGIYTLTSPSSKKPTALSKGYGGSTYFMTGKTGEIMSEYVSKTSVYISSSDGGVGMIPAQKITRYKHSSTVTSTTESRGTYVSDVTSESSSAYPTNGKHTDGYWYVKQ